MNHESCHLQLGSDAILCGVGTAGTSRLSPFRCQFEHELEWLKWLSYDRCDPCDYAKFLGLTNSSGAVDASVVKNASEISWNKVVEFPPFAPGGGFPSYLQWAIPISGFAVGPSRFPGSLIS